MSASTEIEERSLARIMWHKMVKKLEANRGKKHWLESNMSYLIDRLFEEVSELQMAVWDQDSNNLEVWDEAADVANFAAMIAHHHQAKGEYVE